MYRVDVAVDDPSGGAAVVTLLMLEIAEVIALIISVYVRTRDPGIGKVAGVVLALLAIGMVEKTPQSR